MMKSFSLILLIPIFYSMYGFGQSQASVPGIRTYGIIAGEPGE